MVVRRGGKRVPSCLERGAESDAEAAGDDRAGAVQLMRAGLEPDAWQRWNREHGFAFRVRHGAMTPAD